MLLEAVDRPLTYRWPGGEVRLEPGKPIDLPDERAKRLLAKAAGKVRVILPIHPGSQITWTRGDGSIQTGVVDFIHTDAEGGQWAFTTGQSWAAINSKFVQLVTATGPVTAATQGCDISDIRDKSCFACGEDRRWLSIHGATICGICHPPAHAGLVKAWLT